MPRNQKLLSPADPLPILIAVVQAEPQLTLAAAFVSHLDQKLANLAVAGICQEGPVATPRILRQAIKFCLQETLRLFRDHETVALKVRVSRGAGLFAGPWHRFAVPGMPNLGWQHEPVKDLEAAHGARYAASELEMP